MLFSNDFGVHICIGRALSYHEFHTPKRSFTCQVLTDRIEDGRIKYHSISGQCIPTTHVHITDMYVGYLTCWSHLSMCGVRCEGQAPGEPAALRTRHHARCARAHGRPGRCCKRAAADTAPSG